MTEENQTITPLTALLTQLLAACALGTYLCTSLHAPSFYEHLTIGNWISAHAAVPMENLWTSIGQGEAWRSSSWLFELGLSLVENVVGEHGLLIAKVASVVAFVLSVTLLFSFFAEDRFVGTLLASLVVCGTLISVPFNAQLLGLSGVALTLLLCGHTIWGSPWRFFTPLVFLLALLHVNVHSSALAAVVFSAAVLFEAVKAGDADDLVGRRAIVFLATLLIAQFCTPYFGLQLLDASANLWHQFSFDLLFQHSPATIFAYPVAFLLLIWMLIGVAMFANPSGTRPVELLIAAFSTVFALGSSMLTPYALLFSGLLCSCLWGRAGAQSLGNLGRALFNFKTTLSKLSLAGVWWVLLCIVVVNSLNLWRQPSSKTIVPAKAMDYLLEKKNAFPLLHSAAIGSYVLYRVSDEKGVPRQPVAMTPRFAHLSAELSRSERAFESLEPGWKTYASYKDPKTMLVPSSSALYEYLSISPHWRLAFIGGRKVPKGKPVALKVERSPFLWAVFRRRKPRQTEFPGRESSPTESPQAEPPATEPSA